MSPISIGILSYFEYTFNSSGCEMLKIPHCFDNRLTDGGEVNLTLYSTETFRQRG
jgi:hypothetical protein